MDSRNEELKPGYRRVKNSTAKGVRSVRTSPVALTEGTEGNIFNVTIPKLSENEVILTDTLNLIFKFKNSNAKSWFKNNLGRLLCKELTVQMAGKVIYQNTGEGIFERYKDLWKSDAERANARVRSRKRKHSKAHVRRRQRGHNRHRRRLARRLPRDPQNETRKSFGRIRSLRTVHHARLHLPNQVPRIERNNARPNLAKSRKI